MEIRKVEYSGGNKQLTIEWIKYNFPHLTAIIPLIQRTMDSISNFCCLMKQPFILLYKRRLVSVCKALPVIDIRMINIYIL